MLKIVVPKKELWDENRNEFIQIESETTLEIEHSLVSLQEWEMKWHKPFLSKDQKTNEETLDYIRCMTLNDVPSEVYSALTSNEITAIKEYINDSHTATTFSAINKKANNEVITAEIIYYWMIAFNIPPEYRYWHLNSLLTLIQVCNVKQEKPKKMSRSELARRNTAINEARKARLHSKG